MINEQENQIPHEQPQQEQTTQDQQEQPKENRNEYNFRLLREKAEAAERRAADLERLVQMNMNQQQTTKMQLSEETDEDINFNDDSYIEGKDLKRVLKTLRQEVRKTKKEHEEFVTKTNQKMLRDKLSGFDDVVNEENLNKLSRIDPEGFSSLIANPDVYARGKTAYTLIKAAGIIQEPTVQDRRLEENRSKPRSSSMVAPQVGDSPLSTVSEYGRRVLSEERKEQIRKQIEENKARSTF